jgi:hypothetical protein
VLWFLVHYKLSFEAMPLSMVNKNMRGLYQTEKCSNITENVSDDGET